MALCLASQIPSSRTPAHVHAGPLSSPPAPENRPRSRPRRKTDADAGRHNPPPERRRPNGGTPLARKNGRAPRHQAKPGRPLARRKGLGADARAGGADAPGRAPPRPRQR
jgi:hypothetical protein